jgi:hypothetical protein
MNTENKRIPFDWEKYQSGEYEAVCRDGSIPEQITYYQTAKNDYKIVSIINGCIEAFTQDGFWSEPNDENEYDLFLIPKPKKFQAWVNLYSNGDINGYLSKELADHMNKVYTDRGLILVECRLIEWEG